MAKQGVLLVNLGSPDSTAVGDVRRYLRQFLMDGRVLDAPWPVRFCIVHFAILPKRPVESAEAYRKVWLPEGSPLIVSSLKVRDAMRGRFDCPVELAMRYQNPSIESALENLRSAGVADLVVVPLFPHYAMSSYESAAERVRVVAAKQAPEMNLRIVGAFYDDPDYISALVSRAEPHLAGGYDHLLFSFHGIPERHLRKSDPTGGHCLASGDCCSGRHPAHDTCYRAQCFKTMEAFVAKADIPRDRYSVAFQSRLGRDPWLKPYTDHVLGELPGKGVKKLLVMCPAFVSDCLETIEEIGMRGKADFIAAGGENLELIPCLNDYPDWLDALENLVTRHLGANA